MTHSSPIQQFIDILITNSIQLPVRSVFTFCLSIIDFTNSMIGLLIDLSVFTFCLSITMASDQLSIDARPKWFELSVRLIVFNPSSSSVYGNWPSSIFVSRSFDWCDSSWQESLSETITSTACVSSTRMWRHQVDVIHRSRITSFPISIQFSWCDHGKICN